eukprot:5469007-Amphidinium_carterae.4
MPQETLSGETSYYPIVRSTLIQQWYGESDPRASCRSPRNRATHKRPLCICENGTFTKLLLLQPFVAGMPYRPILHVSTRSESKTLRTSSAMTSTRLWFVCVTHARSFQPQTLRTKKVAGLDSRAGLQRQVPQRTGASGHPSSQQGAMCSWRWPVQTQGRERRDH